jgi:hypothetical protein
MQLSGTALIEAMETERSRLEAEELAARSGNRRDRRRAKALLRGFNKSARIAKRKAERKNA